VSERYPGGIITKSTTTPTGPYQNGTAPGIWTLDQQLQFQQQGIWPTAGLVQNYIENVFSTYLYTGTGSTQTITNGINLSGNGGLTWCKARSNPYDNYLFDTARGANNYLISDYTGAQNAFGTYSNLLTSFNSTGFSLGADSLGSINVNNVTYASWTFRKQAKFFDVVTYTGTGANRTISHNLGSTPGCILVKRTDTTSNWQVYHSGLTSAAYSIQLNLTNAQASDTTVWNSTAPTSSVFSVGTSTDVNASGGTYVAYLFASNAGGFGSAGTDNVITCGSFTTDGNGTIPETSLGYEPQWVMFKAASTTGGWTMNDTMRGQPTPASAAYSAPDATLYANKANAESLADNLYPTATGFKGVYAAVVPSTTYIYIAIRRGPMKTPTVGTSVLTNQSPNASSSFPTVTTGWTVDMGIYRNTASTGNNFISSRLQGAAVYMYTNTTAVEAADTSFEYDSNVGYLALSGASNANWAFARAPGFFDEVCYTGTGTYTGSINHNLGVVPEFCIFKNRASVANWWCYHNGLQYPASQGMILNSTAALTDYYPTSVWGGTSTTFITTNAFGTNQASNYVAYLFATCPGVSKVGSYTGNGTTQTINCGFGAGGARWLMVKRTDSTGNWYVFDSARGFTSSSSPYLLMNSTAAQTTGNNGCYADSTGFTVTSTANATVNINGATYIFLAIA
jgi:hypothetical protein